MARVLSATWSLAVRTDSGTVRRAGTDLDALGDAIDELYDLELCDFYTAEEEEDDDEPGEDDNGDDPIDLDDAFDTPLDPPEPGAALSDSPL